jgi:GcrA cell cycle regulator
VSIAADKTMTNPNKKKSKKPKTLLDLESHDCRWPIGEPRHPDFHFCGEPQLPGHPYCERHWRMALQPAKPRYQIAPVGPSTIPKAA